MQTNNLYSFYVDPSGSLCFLAADGSVTARVYDGKASFHSSVPLRTVELEYLLGATINYAALVVEAIRLAGNGIAHMPIVTA